MDAFGGFACCGLICSIGDGCPGKNRPAADSSRLSPEWHHAITRDGARIEAVNIKIRPYKRDAGHAYALGVFPTLELLAHRPEQVLRVLLSERAGDNEGVAKICSICTERNIRVEVADRAIARVGGNEATYAVGVFQKYEASLSADANHLVLVNPDDAGNLGTIVRTMLGFDVVDLAVIRPAADLFAPRTVRASMGAVFQLRYHYFDTFDEYRARFDHHLYPLMTDGRHALGETTFRPPWALVFGNEGAGLGAEFHALGDSVRIPQSDRIDSLNLAVAVAIALYQVTGITQ
jgi:TrmH family RNA methyltransferase